MTRTAGRSAQSPAFPAVLPRPVGTYRSGPRPGALSGFEDLDGSNPRIIILGDTQVTPAWEFWKERNDAQTRAIMAELATRSPAAIINLGDLVAQGDSTRHWRMFDDLHAPVRAARIPYFAVRGNHDYRGHRERAIRCREARLPHLENSAWHAFRFQYAGIILLDSNFAALGRQRADTQNRWFERTLAALEAAPDVYVVICCTHHPPYSNSVTPWPRREVRRRFVAPFKDLRKPGLFFSGHIHTYERFSLSGKHFVVSGGGGGHRSRVRTGPDRWIADEAYQGPPVRPLHFCQLEFNEGSLNFQAVQLGEPASYRFIAVDEFAIPVPRPFRSMTRSSENAAARSRAVCVLSTP